MTIRTKLYWLEAGYHAAFLAIMLSGGRISMSGVTVYGILSIVCALLLRIGGTIYGLVRRQPWPFWPLAVGLVVGAMVTGV